MTIESQLALLILIIIVIFTVARFGQFEPKNALPNPQYMPMMVSFFMLTIFTGFYIIKIAVETIQILFLRK